MAYSKTYNRVNWKNKSVATTTPLNQSNLNKMDEEIYNLNQGLKEYSTNVDSVVTTATEKANAASASATSAQNSATSAETYAGQANTSASSAQTAKSSAETNAKVSESWAVGGTNTRTGEDTNNAKYWSDEAKRAAGGVTGANGLEFDNDTRELSLMHDTTEIDTVVIPGGGEGGADGLEFDATSRELSLMKGEEELDKVNIPGGDVPDIVTAWETTLSDEKVPSEKLVKESLNAKQDTLTIDSAMSSTSTNPVQNKVVNSALASKASNTALASKADISDLNKLRGLSIGEIWNNEYLYEKASIVYYSGVYYFALKDNYQVTPGTDDNTWLPYTVKAAVDKVIELNSNLSQITDYSTSEKVVGKWIDGKTLYQKTVSFTPTQSTTIKTVPHGISNIDTIVRFESFFYASANQAFYPTNFYLNANSFNTMYVDKSNINYIWNSGSGSLVWNVTILYTKL